MITRQESGDGRGERRDTDESLQPFHGFLTPGICFASGHCIWFFQFSSTPLAITSYAHVWMVTPDGERLLFVDPLEAGPYVETYHEFDQVIGATIAWIDAGRERVEIQVDGDDETELEVRAELGASTGTRLLTTITSLTPQRILRTSIGEAISNLTFGLLMDSNGLKVAGATETGQPYRVEADSLRMVKAGSATLNGEELGGICPPPRSIKFGDAIAPNDPFFAFGKLFLQPPVE